METAGPPASGAWNPYCGSAPDPATWLGRWNLDPVLLVALVAGALLSVHLLRGERRLAGLGACAVAVLIFVSPLCALSSALFSARTVHHVLMVTVLAPLVALSLDRRGAAPLAAALGQGLVFWAWHAPTAYGWALANDLAYWLMQVTILGSAVWFWAALRHAASLTAVAALLIAMVLMGLLGALLTFASAPLYAPHLLPAQAWGLGALRDQQVAGLIMWAPAAGAYLAEALRRLWRALGPPRVREAAA